MAGIRKLVLSGNDGTIGAFNPNKTTIEENDLECKRSLIELHVIHLKLARLSFEESSGQSRRRSAAEEAPNEQ